MRNYLGEFEKIIEIKKKAGYLLLPLSTKMSIFDYDPYVSTIPPINHLEHSKHALSE
jgi:hypothetical protein